MPDQAKPASRPWRRFLRFHLRGLVLLVLVIGVWLGWLARSARTQREAVAAIERANGWIGYDLESSSGVADLGQKQSASRWLADLIGVDYFRHVCTVGVTPTGTGAELAHVGRLTRLKRLSLYGSFVSDGGLAHLQSLTELTFLDLSNTNVSDAGLAHLTDLTDLMHLELSSTRVSDKGLVHLKKLTKLNYLNLRATQVSDAGVQELQQALPNLKIKL